MVQPRPLRLVGGVFFWRVKGVVNKQFDTTRRRYQRPVLTAFGDVSKLTRQSSGMPPFAPEPDPTPAPTPPVPAPVPVPVPEPYPAP